MDIEPLTLGAAVVSVTQLAKPFAVTGATLIESLLGKPMEVAGGMLADQIYAWRTLNRLRIAERAKKIMEEEKITPRPVSRGFLLPLLDAAGDIEDETLQEMWARLLAGGVKRDSAQHPIFIETLRRMSTEDAKVLLLIPKGGVSLAHTLAEIRSERNDYVPFFMVDGRTPVKFLCLARLEALGLVEMSQKTTTKNVGRAPIEEEDGSIAGFMGWGTPEQNACYKVSAYGVELISILVSPQVEGQ